MGSPGRHKTAANQIIRSEYSAYRRLKDRGLKLLVAQNELDLVRGIINYDQYVAALLDLGVEIDFKGGDYRLVG